MNRILKKYGSYENFVNYNVCKLHCPKNSIDKGIFDFLVKLNQCGLHTVYGCSGHQKGDKPVVRFATYIDEEDVIKEIKNLFGNVPYTLLKEKNKYGIELITMYIDEENMEKFGIFYC